MVTDTQRLTVGLFLSLSCLTSSYSQSPVTNITPTTGVGDLGTTVTQVDTVRDITGGSRPGNGPNLFHSFENFSIGEGDVANFLNDSGLSTDNILSRVTGGTRSDILGIIRTTNFRDANIFLINPAGVMLSPSAELDIRGSFHVTSGDYVAFEDGSRFRGIPGVEAEVLTTAPVEAFGFLGAAPPVIDSSLPAAINIQGNVVVKGGTLGDQGEFAGVSLIGRDAMAGETLVDGIAIESGGELNVTPPDAGHVSIISVASPGEVPFEEVPSADTWADVENQFDSLGGIRLSNASMVVSGTRQGSLLIRSGQLLLDNSEIEVSGPRAISVAADIRATQDIRIENKSRINVQQSSNNELEGITIEAPQIEFTGESFLGLVSSSFLDDGKIGTVKIKADRIAMADRSIIQTANLGETVATSSGDIVIAGMGEDGSPVGVLDVGDGSRINSSTTNKGAAGNITINAVDLELRDASVTSISQGGGSAGNVAIHADSATLTNTEVSTVAETIAAGGQIEIRGESITLRDTDVLATVKDAPVDTQPDQNIADLSLVAQSLEISGGSVDVQTLGTRNAGQILVEADLVKITGTDVTSSSTLGATGAAGGVVVQGPGGGAAQLVNLTNDSSLTSTAVDGAAGGIEVNADEVALTNATVSSSVLAGEKDAGRVRVNSTHLTMAGSVVASETEGAGDAGSVFLNVSTLEAQGSQITSSSTALGSGQPGSITILKTGSGPANRVTLTDSEILTQIQGAEGGRRPTDAEDVGQIQIIADTLSLDGGRISGATAGIGDASVMRLWANEFALQGSEISSSTSAVGDTPGDAGQIFIRGAQGAPSLANQLALVDSEIRTGTTGGGFGGEIQIDAVDVSLSEGSEISASTASIGAAGDIRAEVDKLSSQDSLITSVSTSAASDAGAAGSIRLSAKDSIAIDKGGLTTVANGGAGGSIDVTATNAVSLAATEVLATVLDGEQPGGGVMLSAREIQLTNGTTVAAESEGTGTAGAVAIGDAGTASLRLQNSTVSTNAAEAKGGDINVQAEEIVHLTDSGITTSVGAGEGQGGNIFIDPQYVILNRSNIQANAVGGPGGRIEIESDVFIASADSVVEAVSATNIQGVVLITAPERDVISGTSVLPAEFQDPSRRLRARCGQRVDVGRSNFQEVGLEGLPPSPDDFLWVIPLLPEAKADSRPSAVSFIQGTALPLTLLPCTGY